MYGCIPLNVPFQSNLLLEIQLVNSTCQFPIQILKLTKCTETASPSIPYSECERL